MPDRTWLDIVANITHYNPSDYYDNGDPKRLDADQWAESGDEYRGKEDR